MKCKICQSDVQNAGQATLLKYEVKFYSCPHCHFLFTEEPYWLDEAYGESINLTDTGMMDRNYKLARKTMVSLLALFKGKTFRGLDYGGGYGVFTRLMRDYGFDFYWQDKYTENLFARGFEFQGKHADVVTVFEAFEHFPEPLQELETLLELSDTIIFSTLLLPKPRPKFDEWWYYGLEHGQHISFYSKETLKFLAKKYELNLYSDFHGFHILTRRKTALLNSVILKGLAVLSPDRWIKKCMGSKTNSDMQALKEN